MATSSIHRLTLLPSSSTGCTVPCPPAGLPSSGLQTSPPAGWYVDTRFADRLLLARLDPDPAWPAHYGPRSRYLPGQTASGSCPVCPALPRIATHLVPWSSTGTPPDPGGQAT